MGRSTSRRQARAGAVALLLGATLLTPPAVASADPNAPVIDIVAPVVDIQFGEADVQGEAKVEQLPKRTTITLDSTVLFAKDSAKINVRADGRLAEIGQRLQRRGPGSVTITGYTDDLGSAAYGLTLSRQRASAVADRLRRQLPEGEFPFTISGKGEADPAAPNTSEANRRTNRRVVVVYQQR
ncbi:MAG TPA: OmpA family protein [Propionibacteriaceae bacterium]|nr:OmpA family protein [Propionibacteriaceae bacterium]